MTSGRGLATAAALFGAAAVAGCGLGAGQSSRGTATLTVTRDYGSESLVDADEEDPPESETVIRFLDRESDITTRYGGGFVQSIDGLSGTESGGRRYDWFFYVNGIESPVGSADVRVHGGDRIWWDYRDWTAAMRVPAVVGSWPEPFLNGAEAQPVSVQCFRASVCDRVTDSLHDVGATAKSRTVALADGGPEAADGPRMLVGPWSEVGVDRAAAELASGPAESGVFARFERVRGQYVLVLLDERGNPVRTLRHRAGLVAAVRDGDAPPTWLVTGTGGAAVRKAAALLDENDLRDRYAVAVTPRGAPVPVPVSAGGDEGP